MSPNRILKSCQKAPTSVPGIAYKRPSQAIKVQSNYSAEEMLCEKQKHKLACFSLNRFRWSMQWCLYEFVCRCQLPGSRSALWAQEGRGGKKKQRAGGRHGDDEATTQAWEWYLRAGSQAPPKASGNEQAEAQARKVDWSNPRSVLGLPDEGRVTKPQLQRAFRRELMLWHPDHNPSKEAEATKHTQAIISAFGTLKSQAI